MNETPGDDVPFRRVAIIQTAFLGDLVLSLPLIDAVKQINTSAKLAVIARPGAAQLLENHPNVDKLFVFEKHGANRGLPGLFRLAGKIRQLKCDLALIPHRSFRSALLARMTGIPVLIGYAKTPGAWLYTKKVDRDWNKYEGARNLDLLQPIVSQDFSPIPSLILPDKAVEEAARLVEASDQEQWIALAPGSVWPTKRWPEQYWIELLKQLEAQGKSCIIVGGPEDAALGDRILKNSTGASRNAAGKLSIAGSAALLKRCSLLVSGDTAPVHLAVAVDTPVLTIFGPTVPEFGFAPIGDKDRVIGLDLSCRPCRIHGSKKCPLGHHDCMKKLAPEMVARAAMQMVQEN